MTLNDLYAEKGKLVTEIEINQSRLNKVNEQIVNVLTNKDQLPKPEAPKENV